MIISDLEHLEVVAEGTNVVGSGIDMAEINSLLKSLGYKPVNLNLSSTSKGGKTVSKKSGNSKEGSVVSASVKHDGNAVSNVTASTSWKNS